MTLAIIGCLVSAGVGYYFGNIDGYRDGKFDGQRERRNY